ncbi:MAG: MBOAT family protein [Phycisphaerae bacterium]|nr:MBOAT family protein [Phycisphaerae bacterium]
MLFQTPEFLILMLVVMAGIVLARTNTLQSVMLLLASYVFYMSWNPVFILLILFSTLNDYVAGLGMGHAKSRRGRVPWLVMSCVTNLGLLAVFKYFNFFVDSMNAVFIWVGLEAVLPTVQLTLPVGISFYTFQSMSYSIDVFRGDTPPEKSFIRFALYVAFFPQLVAGPILRSTEFLPQLYSVKSLRAENLRSGCHLFLSGLVKKVLIADHIAALTDTIFKSPQGLPSILIWLGALAFGIQVYCDFAGYTDMARGVCRMLGFDIPINFNFPFAAQSISDFWRRWHISLASWLRDYLYIPLGGNRHGAINAYRNLMLTMTLAGLWHGAGWNFVLWGVYQGIFLSIERVFGIGGRKRKSKSGEVVAPKRTPLVVKIMRWTICQYFIFLSMAVFRSQNISDLLYCIKKYVLFDFDFSVGALGLGTVNPFLAVGMIGLFVVFHAWSYRVGTLARKLDQMTRPMQLAVYFVVILALFALWPSERVDFVYFQF